MTRSIEDGHMFCQRNLKAFAQRGRTGRPSCLAHLLAVLHDHAVEDDIDVGGCERRRHDMS